MSLSKSLHPRTRNLAAIAIGAISFMLIGRGFAADASEDPWRFSATLPVWAAGIDGDMTVRGQTADLDVGFDDLKDHLDAALSLGFELRRERFGFYGAFGYMKFSGDASGTRGAEADAKLKFLVADAGMAYRLAKVGNKHPFILEAIGGVRYWDIETELEIKGPRGNVLFDGDSNHSLIDPIIGLRGSQYLTEKWHLDFQGDIGGFGISNDSSDFGWSAAGLVTYDAKRWLSLSGGYKALATDVEDGSGNGKKGVDIVMHGLLLTAQFKF
jgi:hypothetical protein